MKSLYLEKIFPAGFSIVDITLFNVFLIISSGTLFTIELNIKIWLKLYIKIFKKLNVKFSIRAEIYIKCRICLSSHKDTILQRDPQGVC